MLFEDRALQTFKIPARIADSYEFSVPLRVEIELKRDEPQSFLYDEIGLA